MKLAMCLTLSGQMKLKFITGSCLLNIGIGSEIRGNTNGEQPGTIPMMVEGRMSSLGQGSAVNPREHACQCWTAQAHGI